MAEKQTIMGRITQLAKANNAPSTRLRTQKMIDPGWSATTPTPSSRPRTRSPRPWATHGREGLRRCQGRRGQKRRCRLQGRPMRCAPPVTRPGQTGAGCDARRGSEEATQMKRRTKNEPRLSLCLAVTVVVTRRSSD